MRCLLKINNVMTFEGFSTDALRFLRELAKHNDRAWFTPRKEIYQTELLDPLRALVADASSQMRKAKIPLEGDPRKSTFRIYRDVRFSPDKSPYKTNLGAFLAYNGDHSAPGGLYIHIQPKTSFVAAGFYQLDKDVLLRWRQAMASRPKDFERMVRALDRNGLHLSQSDDALKRMPRGFESHAESTISQYFRRQSFMVSETLSDEEICERTLIDRLVSMAKRAKPLLTYGWSVLLN
jgi:uncharacterized protein (TIGR02453 family)